MATDPVCGMEVDERGAAASSEYAGQTIHFCSLGCKIAFDRHPERWVAALGSATRAEPLAPTRDAKQNGREVLIATEDLKRVYRRGHETVEALRGVSLEVRRGEFVTVMGPSGGGKSTLLHILGGIDRPTSGRVWVDGMDLAGASEEALTSFRRQKVGFVFQFYNLLPTLTATENVELPLVALGFPKRGRRRMAEEMLDVVGLGDRIDHKPTELSGGEQQRVAIARAIVANPSIVFADEPTGDLDSRASRIVMDLMQDINRRLGLTFLVVTHNPSVGERGDRRLYITDGRIARNQAEDDV